jgi:putative transcriptional regulator
MTAKPGRDEHGNWLRPATEEELDALTDDEIAAAVASDPDAAPIMTEEEWDAALAHEAERDRYGVARLRRRLGMAQIVFADRYGLPYQALRAWERGELEPDRPARVLLAAIAADPELVARAAERARDPGFLLAAAERAAA